MTPFKLCAYWKACRENIDACAERLARCLSALAACDPVFGPWFAKGMSRRTAKRSEIEFRRKDCLIELLDRARNRKDIGKEIIDDLGFHIGIWNGGQSTRIVGLSITCGLYSTAPGLGGNCVVIDLPEELGELTCEGRMANVLVAVVASWEPNWTGVFSLEAMSKRTFDAGRPFIDWMLYLSYRLAPRPKVPAPSLVRPVDELGTLIMVHREPPLDSNDPVHLERVRAVEAALGIE